MNRPPSDSTAPEIRRREIRQRASRRRGAVLIIVLTVLTVATTLFAIWGPAAVRERRQADVRLRAVQANWLVESGIDRAVARLRLANDYTGETWQIAADELGGTMPPPSQFVSRHRPTRLSNGRFTCRPTIFRRSSIACDEARRFD